MLSEFRTFNKDRMDLDELVALAAFGRSLREEYAAQKVDEPDFVNIQLKTINREIQDRVSDLRETRKKQIKAKLQNLKTPQERRAELEAELAELETV